MKAPLALTGLEGHILEVHAPAFFRGPRLTLDGNPAPKGKGRNVYSVKLIDGRTVSIRLKPSLVYDLPAVMVDGEQRQVVSPLRWYQYLLGLFPLVLIFAGLIGIILALVLFFANIRIWRAEIPPFARYLLVITLSFGVPILYYLFLLFLVFFAQSG